MNEPTNGHEPLDPFHYYEVLDRTSVVAELFDFSIAGHPVVDADTELAELAEQVGGLLEAIYGRASDLLDAKLDELDGD